MNLLIGMTFIYVHIPVMLTDLIMEKLYDSNFFSWGSVNLVIAIVSRINYISAIKKADKNDIQPLIASAKS